MKTSMGHRNSSNDECYTTKETAEYVVNKYYYLMEGKKIILPCDYEGSELYKACKAKGLDCDIAQDMGDVDYSKYDLVFTNPPFHGLYDGIRYLNNNDIKYLLFAPGAIVIKIVRPKHDFYHKVHYIEDFKVGEYGIFKQPDGSDFGVHGGLITNLDEGRSIIEAKPDIRIQATNEYQNYKGIGCDLIKYNYFKYDYSEQQNHKLVVRLAQPKVEQVKLG